MAAVTTIALSLVTVTGLAGCAAESSAGDTPDSAPYRVVYAEPSGKIAFAVTVTDSIKAAAAEAGIELTVLDNEGDAATAIENARTAALQEPDLFIEYNITPDSNVQVGKIIGDASIPILAVQYAVEGSPLYAVDNVEVGRIGGEALAAAAVEKWGTDAVASALILNYPEGGATNIERGEGAVAGITETLPDIEIVQGADKNDVTVAAQVVSAFLVSHPDQKLIIWSHLDQYTIAAANAIRAAGREGDVLIASTGGEESILEELRDPDSPVIGTTSLFPATWGAEIIDLVEQILAGDPVQDVTRPSQVTFVDKSNVDEFYS